MVDIETIIDEHEKGNLTGKRVLDLELDKQAQLGIYTSLKSSVTNLFDRLNKTEELENISISEYSTQALHKFSNVLNSSINLWIDTNSRKVADNKRLNDVEKLRFRRKFYSTSRAYVPERINSEIFEKALNHDKGFIGKGVEKREGFNSNTYIISPLTYLDEKAVLAISKRGSASDNDDLNIIDLKLAKYFSEKLDENIKFLHKNNFHELVKDVYNRKKGEKILDGIDMRTRNNESYAILFLDIDDFKPINDNLGHDVGDEVLKRMGYALRKVTRKKDLVYKYGGEEFIVAMINVDQDDIEYKANKLKEHISNDLMEQFSVPITVSIGYNLISPDDNASVAKKIKNADTAMYNAKQISGKNSVVGYVVGMKMPEEDILDIENLFA